LKELRVVVADDSELIRGLLDQSLSYLPGVNIVGMAEDGAQAIRMIAEHKPNVLVLDIEMPQKSGIEVLKHIRCKDASLMIVMFTANPSSDVREACLDAGANHFLDKSQIRTLLNICQQELLIS
jgi:DNA-binding NarL/FixJ family response regulator